MDPCPHDAVQGATNDKCFKNGTLVYQLLDPRTKAQFAKCFNVGKGFNESTGEPIEWTTLSRVKTWQNEGVGELNHIPTPAQTVCPKGYCPWVVPDPANKSNHLTQPCSATLPLGGCGAWGNMTVGYGVGSSLHNIGPECVVWTILLFKDQHGLRRFFYVAGMGSRSQWTKRCKKKSL